VSGKTLAADSPKTPAASALPLTPSTNRYSSPTLTLADLPSASALLQRAFARVADNEVIASQNVRRDG
jgi:hypothetical protein